VLTHSLIFVNFEQKSFLLCTFDTHTRFFWQHGR